MSTSALSAGTVRTPTRRAKPSTSTPAVTTNSRARTTPCKRRGISGEVLSTARIRIYPSYRSFPIIIQANSGLGHWSAPSDEFAPCRNRAGDRRLKRHHAVHSRHAQRRALLPGAGVPDIARRRKRTVYFIRRRHVVYQPDRGDARPGQLVGPG